MIHRSRVSLINTLLIYVLIAYGVMPLAWRGYEHCHPALHHVPTITHTGNGHPGDPLNIAAVGREEDLVKAMLKADWLPADPLSLKSSLKIAGASVLRRPYTEAPVSSLFLFKRKQDLAFEQPVGNNPSKRHHVRFWKSEKTDRDGRPFWIGAVTYDKRIGFSHTTGQITHHIGPDVDRERDDLMAGLSEHGWLVQLYQVTGVGATLLGRNGGGDPYYTDGELTIGVIAPEAERGAAPERLSNPPAVALKQQFWTAIRPLLRSLPTGD